jgi:hypothetical protein
MSLRFIAMASLLIVPLVVPLAAHSAPLGFSPATPGGFGQPSGPAAGQVFMTPRGPGFVTGNDGSIATTTVPGSGGQGFLIDHGNGTSTLLLPGSGPQVVATPR